MRRRHHVARIDRYAGGLRHVEEVSAEVVVGEGVVLLCAFSGDGRGGGKGFTGGGEEGEGKGGAVVGDHGFDEAGAVG